MTRLGTVIAVLLAAAGAVNIVNGLGYEHPQFVVLSAGLLAAALVAVLTAMRK